MKIDLTDNEVKAGVIICVSILFAGTALMSLYSVVGDTPSPKLAQPASAPASAPASHATTNSKSAPVSRSPARYAGQYTGSFYIGSTPFSGRNGKAEIAVNAKGGAVGFAWVAPNELHLLLGTVDGTGAVSISCRSVGPGSSTGQPQGQFKTRFKHNGLWKPYQCEFSGQAASVGKSGFLKVEGLDCDANHEVINLTRVRH